MGEIVRGGCSFALMRNAFVADAALSSPEGVLAAIRRELARLAARRGRRGRAPTGRPCWRRIRSIDADESDREVVA